jgi:hypothetical protein
MHTEGRPASHVKPGSVVQVDEHPSPADVLPSSHVSPDWTRPFPQHWARQACHVALKLNAGTKNVPAMQLPVTSADELNVTALTGSSKVVVN